MQAREGTSAGQKRHNFRQEKLQVHARKGARADKEKHKRVPVKEGTSTGKKRH